MMKSIAMLALVSFGCIQGTATPGLKRCTTVFFVVGFYKACDEGPPWSEGVPPPRDAGAGVAEIEPPREKSPDVAPEPGWWCSTRDDEAIGLCMDRRDRCEAFRDVNGPGGGSGYRPCVRQKSAACAGESCFTSMSVCASVEAKAGRNGSACAEHERR